MIFLPFYLIAALILSSSKNRNTPLGACCVGGVWFLPHGHSGHSVIRVLFFSLPKVTASPRSGKMRGCLPRSGRLLMVAEEARVSPSAPITLLESWGPKATEGQETEG